MYFWISTAVYSLVWLLSPQTVRLLLLGLTILGGVLWLFWGGKRRKDKRALYTVCLLLLLAGAGRFLNTPVAQLKFFCLEGMYRQTAQSLCAELREDGDFGFRMDLQGPSFLSNAGQVQALAENGTLALYFPISESFFNSYIHGDVLPASLRLCPKAGRPVGVCEAVLRGRGRYGTC